jgi:glycosyltransferase involved in cell wall biosynthesis
MRALKTFSVIIPAYNAARTIHTCLAHIEKLEGNKQVIVVDDGSTDDTLAIAQKHKVGLKSIPHSGPSVARNQGVKDATGEILVFVDSDVYLPGDFLVRVDKLFEENPQASAIQALYSDRLFPHNIASLYKQKMQYWMMHRIGSREFCEVGGFAVALRRESFDQVGGFDSQVSMPLCEDLELGYRLTRKGLKIIADHTLVVDHDTSVGLLSLLLDKFNRARWYSNWVSKVRFSRKETSGMLDTILNNKSYVGWEYLSTAILAPMIPALTISGFVCPVLWIPAATTAGIFIAINIPLARHAVAGNNCINPVVFMGLRFFESLALATGMTTGTLRAIIEKLR